MNGAYCLAMRMADFGKPPEWKPIRDVGMTGVDRALRRFRFRLTYEYCSQKDVSRWEQRSDYEEYRTSEESHRVEQSNFCDLRNTFSASPMTSVTSWIHCKVSDRYPVAPLIRTSMDRGMRVMRPQKGGWKWRTWERYLKKCLYISFLDLRSQKNSHWHEGDNKLDEAIKKESQGGRQ